MRASTRARARTHDTRLHKPRAGGAGAPRTHRVSGAHGAPCLSLAGAQTYKHTLRVRVDANSITGQANKKGRAREPHWLASLRNRGCWSGGVVGSPVMAEVSTPPEPSQGPLYRAKRAAAGRFARGGPRSGVAEGGVEAGASAPAELLSVATARPRSQRSRAPAGLMLPPPPSPVSSLHRGEGCG